VAVLAPRLVFSIAQSPKIFKIRDVALGAQGDSALLLNLSKILGGSAPPVRVELLKMFLEFF